MHTVHVFVLFTLCLGFGQCASGNVTFWGNGLDAIDMYTQEGIDWPQRDGERPQNATLLILTGIPRAPHYTCLESDGIENPRKVEVPADVCLFGTFTNTSVLLVDGVICPDGTFTYLAVYTNPTCQGNGGFVQWQYRNPGSFCYSQSAWWTNTHLIQKYSVIFRCKDVPAESMPEHLMDGDAADPVVMDSQEWFKDHFQQYQPETNHHIRYIRWMEPGGLLSTTLVPAAFAAFILLIGQGCYRVLMTRRATTDRFIDLK